MASKRPFITTLPVQPPQAGQADSDPAPIDRVPAVPGHPVYASAPLFSDRFPSSIRLLMLVPQNDSTSQVRATMFSTDLNTLDVPYNALSYAWTHGTSATIMINGRPFNISSDLHQCLQAMSKHVAKGALSLLWVDAICINQADDVERADQVAIMSQIYRGCRECLVWLGPEQDDSHLVVALVEEFEEMCQASEATGEELPLEKINQMCSVDKHGLPLMSFCIRPYWARLWIIQENMLAPQVRLLVGDRHACGESFQLLLRNLEMLQDPGFFNLTRRLGHNLHQLFQLSYAHRNDCALDFLHGLLVSRSCRFTDGRDVVYAFLGLVDPRQIQEMDIKIDYSVSTNRLWGAITSRVVKQSRSLNILSLCQPVTADPDIKEAGFQAKTSLIQHFLDNSMNDFDTALAVWRRNMAETGLDSMAIDFLGCVTLDKAKIATQELQSRRHLMSDSEFKRKLVQAWLPPSKCDRYRLPTWVPNWSNTRKISSQILYGVENGRIAKRDFRASKDTESNTYTLADLDPASLPENTAANDWGSFTTLSFKCHKVDTIAQTFNADGLEHYQAVLEFWLVQSNLHPMLAAMSLPERVTAFVDMLLLRARNDTTHLYGYDDMVDRWVKSSREACIALINESADGDKPVDARDSPKKPSAPTLHFVDSERPICFLNSSERPAAVTAALQLLASDTVEHPTPQYMDAPDWTPENYRAKVESLRESWSRMNELAGNYNIFLTRGGFIGLAGSYVENGDVVCIPLGCDVPLIIRPAPDTSTVVQEVAQSYALRRGKQAQGFCDGSSTISQGISELLGPEYRVVDRPSTISENYWLISESYVLGIMDGEYLDQLDDGAEPEMVTIY